MAVTISYLESFLAGMAPDIRRRLRPVLEALLRENADMKTRLDALETTSTDHEARITALEP